MRCVRTIVRASTCALLFALLVPLPAVADPPQYGNGSIVGWGSQVVGGDLSTDCVAVAGGGLHSLALKSDGSIVAWGYNNCGQCDVAAPNTGYLAVAGGNWHSLGLKAFTPPGSRGDLDCDGDVDYDDMDPFVLALSGQAGYEVAYPGCNWLNGDCNDDGTVDFDDIDPFVAILSGG